MCLYHTGSTSIFITLIEIKNTTYQYLQYSNKIATLNTFFLIIQYIRNYHVNR